MEINYIQWIVLGLLLMGTEILAPGAFLLWIGIAAIVVGGMAWIMPLSVTSQLVLFAILAPVMAILGRNVFGSRQDELEQGTLNRRGDMMIGKVITLSNPIVNGEGKTTIGDSMWTVHGPDLPVGTKVKILKVEGNVLLVSQN